MGTVGSVVNSEALKSRISSLCSLNSLYSSLSLLGRLEIQRFAQATDFVYLSERSKPHIGRMGQLAAIWSDHTEEVWGGTGAREEPLKAWVTLILQLRGCLRESFYLISFVSL